MSCSVPASLSLSFFIHKDRIKQPTLDCCEGYTKDNSKLSIEVASDEIFYPVSWDHVLFFFFSWKITGLCCNLCVLSCWWFVDMVIEKSLNGKCGGGCVATTLLICSTCSLLPYKVELLFHIIEKGTASECKMEIQKSLQLPDKTHFLFFFFF